MFLLLLFLLMLLLIHMLIHVFYRHMDVPMRSGLSGHRLFRARLGTAAGMLWAVRGHSEVRHCRASGVGLRSTDILVLGIAPGPGHWRDTLGLALGGLALHVLC